MSGLLSAPEMTDRDREVGVIISHTDHKNPERAHTTRATVMKCITV